MTTRDVDGRDGASSDDDDDDVSYDRGEAMLLSPSPPRPSPRQSNDDNDNNNVAMDTAQPRPLAPVDARITTMHDAVRVPYALHSAGRRTMQDILLAAAQQQQQQQQASSSSSSADLRRSLVHLLPFQRAHDGSDTAVTTAAAQQTTMATTTATAAQRTAMSLDISDFSDDGDAPSAQTATTTRLGTQHQQPQLQAHADNDDDDVHTTPSPLQQTTASATTRPPCSTRNVLDLLVHDTPPPPPPQQQLQQRADKTSGTHATPTPRVHGTPSSAPTTRRVDALADDVLTDNEDDNEQLPPQQQQQRRARAASPQHTSTPRRARSSTQSHAASARRSGSRTARGVVDGTTTSPSPARDGFADGSGHVTTTTSTTAATQRPGKPAQLVLRTFARARPTTRAPLLLYMLSSSSTSSAVAAAMATPRRSTFSGDVHTTPPPPATSSSPDALMDVAASRRLLKQMAQHNRTALHVVGFLRDHFAAWQPAGTRLLESVDGPLASAHTNDNNNIDKDDDDNNNIDKDDDDNDDDQDDRNSAQPQRLLHRRVRDAGVDVVLRVDSVDSAYGVVGVRAEMLWASDATRRRCRGDATPSPSAHDNNNNNNDDVCRGMWTVVLPEVLLLSVPLYVHSYLYIAQPFQLLTTPRLLLAMYCVTSDALLRQQWRAHEQQLQQEHEHDAVAATASSSQRPQRARHDTTSTPSRKRSADVAFALHSTHHDGDQQQQYTQQQTTTSLLHTTPASVTPFRGGLYDPLAYARITRALHNAADTADSRAHDDDAPAVAADTTTTTTTTHGDEATHTTPSPPRVDDDDDDDAIGDGFARGPDAAWHVPLSTLRALVTHAATATATSDIVYTPPSDVVRRTSPSPSLPCCRRYRAHADDDGRDASGSGRRSGSGGVGGAKSAHDDDDAHHNAAHADSSAVTAAGATHTTSQLQTFLDSANK